MPRYSLQARLGDAESAIYIVVAVLLVVAATFTLVGTIVDLVEGAQSREITDAGVVEPFLFIGLIATVRKVLVLTAEVQQKRGDMTDFLVQIAALAGLGLVLSVSIHLLRRSGAQAPPSPLEAEG